MTYYHAGDTIGSGRYDVTGIMDALRKHASHSLQQLDPTADYDALIRNNEDVQEIDSLRYFQRLRIIRVDNSVFALESALDGALNEDFYKEEVARLVDVLPASVRVLKLVPGMKHECAGKVAVR